MNTTKIIESISISRYKQIISKYKSRIKVGYHALDMLSDSQRKVFKEEELVRVLVNENPRGIGLQKMAGMPFFSEEKVVF